ncbi:MAG TPA: glycosyltransferase family 4 protein [Candidatus Limnocylindria bacterium]|nr:glycosyltransferase family 4 protein [Candidatus Limnocylindria bacterium]
MRIVLVTHYMPPHVGGVEQVAATLAGAYGRAGHDVTWLSTAVPRRATGLPAVHAVRVAAWNILERRRSMPFPLVSPTAYPTVARTIRGADVVHIHDCIYLTSVLAAVASARASIPYVVTQHVAMVPFGRPVDAALRATYRTVGRAVLRRAARVVYVSAAVRHWFTERVGPDVDGAVIENAVDTERFRPPAAGERETARDRLGVPRSARVVLFTGRLVPKKNVGVVAAAASSARVHLLVVGDGPERSALARTAALTHVPNLPHDRMTDAYWAADVFVLPSVGEGLPVSAVEAAACGLPLVVSTDPAFDALEDAGAVRVVPVATELAQTLASADAARGATARAWAERSHGARAFAEAYLAMLTAARR